MPPADDPKEKGHTLTDHVYGIDLAHSHDGYADHDHDEFPDDEGPLEDNPLWRPGQRLADDVGIDIGSSGTQVIFSRVHLRRLAEDLTSRYYVVSRETLFQSPVALTPYQHEERIDDAKLGAIIDDAYDAADTPSRQYRYRRRSSSPARRCGARTRKASRHPCPSRAANSSAPPPGITWNRCSPPTAPAPPCLQRRAQAHPQHRHRRRHHQARPGRERPGNRDRGRPYRRPPAGRRDGKIVRLDPAGKYHAKRAGFSWDRGDAIDAGRHAEMSPT